MGFSSLMPPPALRFFDGSWHAVRSASDRKVVVVQVSTPESPEPQQLAFTETKGRIQFAVPKFLVYAVVNIQLK